MHKYQNKYINPGTLFCFGLGYTGQHLANKLYDLGWQIKGTAQTTKPLEYIDNRDIQSFPFGGKKPIDPLKLLSGTVSHLISCIPPNDCGDPVIRHHTKNIIEAENIKWVGYLSTTGVYGNRDGKWVDENDAPRPSNIRSQNRLSAERSWLSLWEQYKVPVHIFRLAGIYGPERNVLSNIKQGNAKRIDKPNHLFSRIYVDDIVQILFASMCNPNPGRIYNVCDDEAAAPSDVIEYGCRLLQVKAPPLQPFKAKQLSPMARTFWMENRLVSNARIKSELGIELQYPNYRKGLSAIHKMSLDK